MKLAQITDCHLLATPDAKGYADIQPYHSLCAVIDDVSAQNPDHVIVTGDISGDDSQASYALFKQAMQTRFAPNQWTVLGGNHDNNPHFDAEFANFHLAAGKPLELGQWCIHGLDTRWRGTRGIVQPVQLGLIGTAIKTQTDAHHILAMHHHPVASESWMDRHDLSNPKMLAEWLAALKQIKLIIHGHIHHAKQVHWAQTEVMSAPSTCWQWAMQAEFGVADASPGWRLLELQSDGQWSSTIRRIP